MTSKHKYGIIITEYPDGRLQDAYHVAGFDDEALAQWLRTFPDFQGASSVEQAPPGMSGKSRISSGSPLDDKVHALFMYDLATDQETVHPSLRRYDPNSSDPEEAAQAVAIEALPEDRLFRTFDY